MKQKNGTVQKHQSQQENLWSIAPALLYGFLQGTKSNRQAAAAAFWVLSAPGSGSRECCGFARTKHSPGSRVPSRLLPSSRATFLPSWHSFNQDQHPWNRHSKSCSAGHASTHKVTASSRIVSSQDIQRLHPSTKQNYARMESPEPCCFPCPLPRFMEKMRWCKQGGSVAFYPA